MASKLFDNIPTSVSASADKVFDVQTTPDSYIQIDQLTSQEQSDLRWWIIGMLRTANIAIEDTIDVQVSIQPQAPMESTLQCKADHRGHIRSIHFTNISYLAVIQQGPTAIQQRTTQLDADITADEMKILYVEYDRARYAKQCADPTAMMWS